MAIDITTSSGLIIGVLWFTIFVILLVLLLTIIWIASIIHCIFSRLKPGEKIVWLLAIIILNLLGTLLYFLFANYGGKKMAKKSTKGKQLSRSKKNRVLAGVCGGIGEYFQIDPTLVRLVWIVIWIFTGFVPGLIVYLLAWIVMPEK